MGQGKTVLVAGFFDLLHSGHVRFLEECGTYGEVTVSLGSDANSLQSKGRMPVCSEAERKYMLEAMQVVHRVEISSPVGPLSFREQLEKFKPDYFIINEDGHSDKKRELCESLGAEYVVLKREPHSGLSTRSSSGMRSMDQIPHRLDIVGFFDQVFLSGVCPGSTVMCGLEPLELDERSGMASSTRETIKRVFGNALPRDKTEEEIAKIIFACENPPGRQYVSGAVDALGLVSCGLSKFNFEGEYWPASIDRIHDESVMQWFENHVQIVQTRPRPIDYNVFSGGEDYAEPKVKRLAAAGEATWAAIRQMDAKELGACVNETSDACKAMISGYISDEVLPILSAMREQHLGVKLLGAGGYGYMLVVAEQPITGGLRVTVRRSVSM
jgi:cytidyltransferase-like protein